MCAVAAAERDTKPAPAAAATELAAVREREADELLDLPWWKPWLWFRRPWDSESRKSLARIKTSLETALELDDRNVLGSQAPRLARVLERPLSGRSLDSLIETVYALDEVLVATGDAQFLCRRLCAETLPDREDTDLTAIRAGLVKDPSSLTQAELDAVQQALLTLYEMRRFRYRRQRARGRMKRTVLLLAGLLLLGLAIALGLAVDEAIGDDPNFVILAAVAGAVGGTLANLFRVRDELRRGTELRAFKPMLIAQPAVGAASGLVLLLIVEGGLLGITNQSSDTRWATTTLLGFVGGLSEALFLGIVRRATIRLTDEDEEKKDAGRADRPAEDSQPAPTT